MDNPFIESFSGTSGTSILHIELFFFGGRRASQITGVVTGLR
jgi:hypothetical protein